MIIVKQIYQKTSIHILGKGKRRIVVMWYIQIDIGGEILKVRVSKNAAKYLKEGYYAITR